MAKLIMYMDVDVDDDKKTTLDHDGGNFGQISYSDLLKMGEITKIEHATIIYHKSNPSSQNCVTIILNGIPTRVCRQ